MTFEIRWPDGAVASCYSPSLVMHDYLVEGADYPLAEFVDRSTTALRIASERVAARYGFACTSAMQQESEIVAVAGRYPGGTVRVLEMFPPLPAPETAPASGSASASASASEAVS